VTVVLSEKGWVRAGKGHEIDPKELSYKAGDGYLASALGKSNQSAHFLDSTGRSYSLPAHGLPSARSQGEPLSSHLRPPSGASFVGLAMGAEEDMLLVATSAGYGFLVTLGDLPPATEPASSILTVSDNAKVPVPQPVTDPRPTSSLPSPTEGTSSSSP
jgi:topoisomerase-4 subunit A